MPDDTEGQKPDTEAEEQSGAEEEVKEIADSEESGVDEKETQSESSAEEKPGEEAEGEESEKSSEEKKEEEQEEKPEAETADTPAGEPKPVEGETTRERALRLEVQRLRGERREKRTQELFGKPERAAEEVSRDTEQKQRSSRMAELEKKFDPKELQNFREALEAAAEDLGFVKKDDLQATTYNQTASGVLDSFVEKHPEYLPENDKDDVLWKQFQVEFALYKKPDDPRKFTKIFDRIHRTVVGEKPQETKAAIEAKTQKVKSASHSASRGAAKGEESLHQSSGKLDPALKPYLKGDFSDLDL